MRIQHLLLIAALLTAAIPAAAETFVFDHLLEVTGRAAVDRSPGTSDTVIHASAPYLGDPGTYPTVFVYTYLDDGGPVIGPGGEAVCAPCVLDLAASPSADMSLIEVMVAAGISAPPALGYMKLETSGPNADQVALTVETEVYHDSGVDFSVLTPLRGPCGGTGGGGISGSTRTFVFPHALETAGSVQAQPNSFDTSIFITYTGTEPAVNTDVFIFDQSTGQALLYDDGTAVCAPCTFTLGADAAIAPRKRKVSVETLLYGSPAGTYPFPSAEALIIVQAGDDVSIGGATVLARSGPGDLSVFVFEPQPIAAAATVSVVDVARRHADLRNYPDPFNPKTTISFSLDREDAATLRIVDVKGRTVRTLNTGRLPAGDHALAWDGRGDDGAALPAGVYLARLQTSTFASVEKMALLK